MASSHRSFVLRHTRLQPVPGLEHLRLHLADEVLPLWHSVQQATGDPDAGLPYWAFALGGGLALAHYLRHHPEAVRRRRVFDLATGSGLVALAALDAGAGEAAASDIDPFATAAVALNARANRRRLDMVSDDVLDDAPPAADVVLCGDAWYEAGFAARVLPWLRRCRDGGLDVLIGDPGRRYLPREALEPLAAYQVRTTTELEDLALKEARVYRLRD
jgi:predicted nicotinamide N-methyase